MRSFVRRTLTGVAAAGLAVSCSQDFDTTRVPLAQGTLGEEVFHVVCERVDVGENPTDITFERARTACTAGIAAGGADPAGVGPKVTALGHMRPTIAAAIDQGMPLPLHQPLDRLLINLLPLYGQDGTGRAVVNLPDAGTAPAEDLLPQTTRALTAQLGPMSLDQRLLPALARMSQHRGYRPARSAFGVMRPLFAYDRVDDVLDNTLRLIRDAGPNAPAGPASGHFHTLLATLQGEFLAATSAPADQARGGTTLDATLDLLLRGDPGLATGHPIDLVRRDTRGLPVVLAAAGGALPAPFADDNHDGLADADANAAVFVRGATPLANVPTPFPVAGGSAAPRDAANHALAGAGGGALYRYLDLNPSLLATLARQLPPLLGAAPYAQVPLMQFLHGSSALLGGRRMDTRTYVSPDDPRVTLRVDYNRFTADDAPLVDLVHAGGQLMGYHDLDAVLTTTRALVSPDREATTARVIGAMLGVNEASKRHPEAVMAETSDIWDDVMGVVQQIAHEPGLLEDILRAMGAPGTSGAPGAHAADPLGSAFAQYARFKDHIEPNWSLTGFPLQVPSPAAPFAVPVDRAQPDVAANRSLLQRLFWLVDDLNGAQLCSKAGATVSVYGIPLVGHVTLATGNNECDIFRVDDAAVFYLQAIDGSAHIDMHIPGLSGLLLEGVRRLFPLLPVDNLMDALIEAQSHIPGFNSHPTPQAINRLVFNPNPEPFLVGLVDPALTNHGARVRERHQGTIFAWELLGFYDALRPLVHAFVLHHKEHLLVQLFSAMHHHWASPMAGTVAAGGYQNTNPAGDAYSTGDGAVRYEPVLVETLGGDLVPALSAMTADLPTIDAGGGRRGPDAIASLARGLLDPVALPVAYRTGLTTTTRSDGTTAVPAASLYYLFADAFDRMDALFAADHDPAHARLADWQAARSAMVDQFLAVDGTGPAARFHNRAFPRLGPLLVGWIQDRVAAHDTLGDRDTWARGLGGRFAATVQGPAFAGAVDLALDINDDPGARASTAALLNHLLDDTGESPRGASPFGTTTAVVADLVQEVRADGDVDPLLHALAPAFQPGVGLVPKLLHFLDRAHGYDTERVLTHVLANLVQRPEGSDDAAHLAPEPLVALGDAIADTHRAHPGDHGPLGGLDFHYVFAQVRDFFADPSRGLEQFYYIVQHRRLP